ncbi:MAG TPA: ABC transporter permease, partial [Gemmatimonadales bacterium]|nr:ABC transporter permease [Gemmatimonadales bacterium]
MMLRVLRQAPAYSAAILGMLTLSTVVLIGTAVQVDAALFRPPEFPGVDRLVIVYNLESAPGRPDRRVRWSYRGVSLLRQLAAPSLEVANYSPSLLPLTLESEAEAVTAEIVSPDYFALLEAAPIIGRGFRPDEDSVPGAGPVTVLSHGLWQRRFGGDSGIVGRQVRVSGTQLTVIGVMGPRFHGLSGNAALWVPAAMAPTLSYPEYLTSDQHFISAVGRLRPGVGLQQADRQLELVGQAITSQLDSGTTGATVRTSAIPLNQARINGSTRRSLLLLLAGASLLHLLAIANVVNLMLARAAARQREAAILVAIGGSTWQRLRYFATEGMAFSFLATGIGLVIAWAATPLLAIPADAWGPRSLYGSLATFSTVEFGVRELVLALLLGTGTALLVTWAPVVALLHPSLGAMQRDGGGISRGGATLRRLLLRGVIVAVEAGLAMVLLVAGGLLIESYRRMRATDLGIEPDHVLSFWIRPSESRVPTDQAPAFVARVLSAIEALPGVEAATVDGGGPLSGSARSTLIIAGHPPARPEDAPPILRHYVGPNHFRVLGVPLLRGRAFDQRDRAGSPRVVVISESAARRFWPNSDPI